MIDKGRCIHYEFVNEEKRAREMARFKEDGRNTHIYNEKRYTEIKEMAALAADYLDLMELFPEEINKLRERAGHI